MLIVTASPSRHGPGASIHLVRQHCCYNCFETMRRYNTLCNRHSSQHQEFNPPCLAIFSTTAPITSYTCLLGAAMANESHSLRSIRHPPPIQIHVARTSYGSFTIWYHLSINKKPIPYPSSTCYTNFTDAIKMHATLPIILLTLLLLLTMTFAAPDSKPIPICPPHASKDTMCTIPPRIPAEARRCILPNQENKAAMRDWIRCMVRLKIKDVSASADGNEPANA